MFTTHRGGNVGRSLPRTRTWRVPPRRHYAAARSTANGSSFNIRRRLLPSPSALPLPTAPQGPAASASDPFADQHAARSETHGRRPRAPLRRRTRRDGLFWILLAQTWGHWRSAFVLVQPDTVVRWHREWLRRRWAWRPARAMNAD